MTPHTDHDPDGPDTPEQPRRRGVDPLSAASRLRLLAVLLRAAENGDVSAQRALVELSLSAARDEELADVLRRLRAGGAA